VNPTMKGVIIGGGLGTRLYPLTHATNKHLLPVYDRPMVFYPIQTLVNAGITEILIVTGGPHAGDYLHVLKNGQGLGMTHLEFAYQEKEGGIAQALSLAEAFSKHEKIAVILGDNIFEDSFRDAIATYETQKRGAKIFLKEVGDPQRFGVAEIAEGAIVRIEEKPKEPKSRLAVTGIYFYDEQVWDVIRSLKPSGRGELEITDVNNFYITQGTMTHEILLGWWTDAGTFDSLLRAANLVKESRS